MTTGFTAAELRQLKLSDSIDAQRDLDDYGEVVPAGPRPLSDDQRAIVAELRSRGVGTKRICRMLNIGSERLKREMPR